jgi:cation-transporting P-type ATPase 13A2
MKRLSEMASSFPSNMQVLRDETWQSISNIEIVPGDIIEVPTDIKMPCDCILIQGTSIVNEAMLTGESCPVLKNSANLFHEVELASPEVERSTLYSGT